MNYAEAKKTWQVGDKFTDEQGKRVTVVGFDDMLEMVDCSYGADKAGNDVVIPLLMQQITASAKTASPTPEEPMAPQEAPQEQALSPKRKVFTGPTQLQIYKIWGILNDRKPKGHQSWDKVSLGFSVSLKSVGDARRAIDQLLKSKAPLSEKDLPSSSKQRQMGFKILTEKLGQSRDEANLILETATRSTIDGLLSQEKAAG
ncbi:MAG: hypothetical protein HQL31_11210 [Planctomycetes bacterium]|nr:hypothetical protein [Planctomycetota bacterium]